MEISCDMIGQAVAGYLGAGDFTASRSTYRRVLEGVAADQLEAAAALLVDLRAAASRSIDPGHRAWTTRLPRVALDSTTKVAKRPESQARAHRGAA